MIGRDLLFSTSSHLEVSRTEEFMFSMLQFLLPDAIHVTQAASHHQASSRANFKSARRNFV